MVLSLALANFLGRISRLLGRSPMLATDVNEEQTLTKLLVLSFPCVYWEYFCYCLNQENVAFITIC